MARRLASILPPQSNTGYLWVTMRTLFLCLAIMCCPVLPGNAQESPRSLAGFRLGMSVDEARAIAPKLRWPEDESVAFRVRSGRLELGGGAFNLDLLFVRGTLEHMSIEGGSAPVNDPQACLRGLDDIVEDLEVQVGPLNGAAAEGQAGGTPISETRTRLGSRVRHYRNDDGGALVGVAYAVGVQRVEARVLVMPGGRANWGCVFLLSVAPILEPPPEAPLVDDATPRLTNIEWLRRPAADDFSRTYPALAAQASRSGDVVLDCEVEPGGLLSCAVASESPEGWGFGAAAHALSRQFRIAPQTRDGIGTEGGRVVLPIRFRVP